MDSAGHTRRGRYCQRSPRDGVSRTITYDYTGAPVTLTSLTIDLVGGDGTASTTLSMSANQLSSGPEYVGRHGAGTFDQSGGTNMIVGDNNLYIGYAAGSHGTYNLSGTGSLAMGDATLAGIEYVGYNGTGTFNQSGGTNTVSHNDLVVGYNSGSVGTYTLSGGTLSAGVEYLGFNGGTGVINQIGGTNAVGTLVISNSGSGSHGAYETRRWHAINRRRNCWLHRIGNVYSDRRHTFGRPDADD